MADIINTILDPLVGYTNLPRIDSSTNISSPSPNNLTNLTDLMSYTLPSATLRLSGTAGVKIIAFGTFATNANVKTVNLLFGTSTLATITGAFNGGYWRLESTVLRITDTTEISSGLIIYGTTPTIALLSSSPTENLLVDVIIKAQGQSTLTGDVTQTIMMIQNI